MKAEFPQFCDNANSVVVSAADDDDDDGMSVSMASSDLSSSAAIPSTSSLSLNPFEECVEQSKYVLAWTQSYCRD